MKTTGPKQTVVSLAEYAQSVVAEPRVRRSEAARARTFLDARSKGPSNDATGMRAVRIELAPKIEERDRKIKEGYYSDFFEALSQPS